MTTTYGALSQDIQRVKYLATGSATISHADLVGTNGWGRHLNSPALPIINKIYLSQAAARAAISECGQFSLRAIPRTGVRSWLVDVDIDINGYPVLKVTAGAGVGDAIIELVFTYSKVK